MGEEVAYVINDTHRAIQRIMDDLNKWAAEFPDACDPRIKAIMITHLEEAQLWSLKVVRRGE